MLNIEKPFVAENFNAEDNPTSTYTSSS